jgi:AcrR family transcriptional regulator
MARAIFSPDDKQARILGKLRELAQQRKAIEEETDRAIVEADQARIPIAHIAKDAEVTRKTVYRHLGKPMK